MLPWICILALIVAPKIFTGPEKSKEYKAKAKKGLELLKKKEHAKVLFKLREVCYIVSIGQYGDPGNPV